ncbi:MAG: BPSL0067 family protein [Proteobacteria bacterium]|nr:BPSL0067 family protein [Pseudomonadota bacterium]
MSGKLVVDTQTSSPSYSANLAGGSYRWNVAACNDAGCSSYTDRLYFQIPAPDQAAKTPLPGDQTIPTTANQPTAIPPSTAAQQSPIPTSPGLTSNPGPSFNSPAPNANITSQQEAESWASKWISATRDTQGYVYPAGTPQDLRHECVALVKQYTSTENIGSSSWRPGTRLDPANPPNISPGTPVATFNPDGTYADPKTGLLENGKLGHTAIFIGYYEDASTGAITGMWVIDQYSVKGGKPAGVSLKLFSDKTAYSVIVFPS